MTMTSPDTFRLLTRSDMDGLVSAVLLRELGMLGSVEFAHPKDMQDGLIQVNERDIITNLPYVEGCGLCFDHHSSEERRLDGRPTPGYVLEPNAKSAARVVYDFYGGLSAFPRIGLDMMEAVDKADSADFTREDVLEPKGWALLSFLMDARTGLGRFRDFRISNYDLMMQLIDCCRDMGIDEILALPDVAERVALYREHHERFVEQLQRVGEVHDNLVVLDLRGEEIIYAGNRFVVYALFPDCDISMHVMWGRARRNTVYTVGKSIFDRNNCVDVGELMLRHGGGGHHAAGTCQGPNERADELKSTLIDQIVTRSLRVRITA